MSLKEQLALLKNGVILGKIHYYGFTHALLSPDYWIKSRSWPDLPNPWDWDGCGTNTSMICFQGKRTGLMLDANGDRLSVSLEHPLAGHWLSILQPIWDEANKDKCPGCHGSGWDGETYTISCFDCGGTGKPKKI